MGHATDVDLATVDNEKYAGDALTTQPAIADIEMDDEHDPNDVDTIALARLGKRSVLKRRFGFISMLGFTCTILITWEGQLILFTFGLTNGGSAGLIYEYLFVWLGTLCVFATMAELASMAPVAGGQYHWVTMLAPDNCKVFISYIMGWLVICGWQGVLASGGYIAGTMIEALIQLNYPAYIPQNWHGTLLFWAVIMFAIFINTVTSKVLPKIEACILILHIVGFFALMIPLVYLAPEKVPAKDVFTVFLNGGGWPTQGVSFFVGCIGTVFALLGCDSAVHMAEEIRNAPVVVPWAMVVTTILNGILGFGMVLAVLFVTPNVSEALESSTGVLGYPFMQIFYEATGSLGGASAMIAVVIIMDAFGTIAFLATASRLVWSFARDRGIPGWTLFSKVRPESKVPVYAVLLTSVIACLIGLINIGSSAAFNGVISLSISTLYASYLITESLLLYRRVKGHIKNHRDTASHTGEPNELIWGPFCIPGIWGIAVNVTSIVFALIIFFFSFWPVATPVIPKTMNFSILMTGTVVLLSLGYYFLYARRTYLGPIVEINLARRRAARRESRAISGN